MQPWNSRQRRRKAAAAAAATSAAEDEQAATEVLKALDETMAAAAKVAGFGIGLKGIVEQLKVRPELHC